MNQIKINYTGKPKRIKKKRYLNRELRKIVAEVNSAKLDLKDNWFNIWHHHLDWDNLGQESSKWRKFFVGLHYKLFIKYTEQIRKSNFDAQCWLFFDLKESGYDAVYIHSKNPQNDYPLKIELNQITENEIPKELCFNGSKIEVISYYDKIGNIFVETSQQANSTNSIKKIKKDS
ncbi:hypothetical protein KAH94_06465 [bacterium]|nr:hypothetical protein [bacterium]